MNHSTRRLIDWNGLFGTRHDGAKTTHPLTRSRQKAEDGVSLEQSRAATEFAAIPTRDMPDSDFCDLYPRFLETTETVPSRSRLNSRWRAIIGWNREILTGRRIMDLGSHDGRWSFAALKAGAAHVTGVEARSHLADKAAENFRYYGATASSYEMKTGDAVEALRATKAGSVDVLMCLGFFYHTMEHMRIVVEARRIGVAYIIVDSHVSSSEAPIIALSFEAVSDTRNSIDYGLTGNDRVLVGSPSRSGLGAMLDYAGYRVEYFNWRRNGVDDWTDMPDYAADLRVTARACRVPAPAPGAADTSLPPRS
jgi:hypothetical protein